MDNYTYDNDEELDEIINTLEYLIGAAKWNNPEKFEQTISKIEKIQDIDKLSNEQLSEKYYEIINTIFNCINEHMNDSEYIKCLDKLSEIQVVVLEDINYELVKIVNKLDSKSIEYNFSTIGLLLKPLNILEYVKNTDYKESIMINNEFLESAINCYNNAEYTGTAIILLVIIDDVLSQLSNMITNTSGEKRLNRISSFDMKIADGRNNLIINIYSTLYTFLIVGKSIFERSDFSKIEPDKINRHWIMHGKSRRKISKADCDKLIRFIGAIKVIDMAIKDERWRPKVV